MSLLGAAAISGGASLIGGLLGNRSSAREAEKNRSFQEQMSDTSYQRAVQDMRAAGINPMLSAKVGGASTPSGSTASQSDVISPAVSSANQARAIAAQVDQAEAGARKTTAEAVGQENLNTVFETVAKQLGANVELTEAHSAKARSDVALQDQQISHIGQQIESGNVSMAQMRQSIAESQKRIEQMSAGIDVQKQQALKLFEEIKGIKDENVLKSFAAWYSNRYGESEARFKHNALAAKSDIEGELNVGRLRGAKAVSGDDLLGFIMTAIREMSRAGKGQ